MYEMNATVQLHVSDESEHSFRSNPIIYFGFIRSVSKVHPVSIGSSHNDLPASLRFVQKTHTAGNAHRRMELTTKQPNPYRLTEAEFRQFASTAVRSTSIAERVLYVINGKN